MLLKNPESTTSRPVISRVQRAHQFVRNDSEQRAQLEDVPGFAPQNRQRRIGPRQRITLARDGLDQRRFAAAVRPQDRHVLARADAERNIVEHLFFAEHHGDAVEGQQSGRIGGRL